MTEAAEDMDRYEAICYVDNNHILVKTLFFLFLLYLTFAFAHIVMPCRAKLQSKLKALARN